VKGGPITTFGLVDIFGHSGQTDFLFGQSYEFWINFDLKRGWRFAEGALKIPRAHHEVDKTTGTS
jgi:hypothetical protein